MSNTSHVHIVTALTCEARPIIDALKLKRVAGNPPFTIFSNDEIFVIISGVGKINAASATAFLHAKTQLPSQAFYLNIGIAGSTAYPVGELVAAHKIIDSSTAQAWYPNMGLHKFKHTANLQTVDQPSNMYPDNSLVDMEAAGFFSIAARLVGLDQVQVLKVISDNDENSIANITAHRVTQLIEQQLEEILKFIQQSKQLSLHEATLLPDQELIENILKHWHFTNYQQHQLIELIRRWKINFPSENILEKLQSFKHSDQVLNFLQK